MELYLREEDEKRKKRILEEQNRLKNIERKEKNKILKEKEIPNSYRIKFQSF